MGIWVRQSQVEHSFQVFIVGSLLFELFAFCRSKGSKRSKDGHPPSPEASLLSGFSFLELSQARLWLCACSMPRCPSTCCSASRGDSVAGSRSTVQGSFVCVCSKDGNDYHKRRKQDYVRHSPQICPFSKPSCFALQNHILFCSSSGAVWCWSWIWERLGSKSAVFTNTGGMSARYGQIQI